MSEILVIEDEGVIRRALRRLLERHGHSVSEAGSVEEARRGRDPSAFDLIISDLRLPGAPGTDVIALAGNAPVLIMTSYASVPSAVEAMKAGAVDYIAKPFDHDEMLLLVGRILRQATRERQAEALRADVERDYPPNGLIGDCPAMQAVQERIRRVAPTDVTVLILGESGTGKELVARALHAASHRSEGPLIAVNCAAIAEGLIESELFGHEKGAFTGATGSRQGLVEAAAGGTLFLDEIGELPPSAQARLLRALQEGEVRRVGADQVRRVDFRLLAATHRDLEARVADGRFREDLYFRLRVMEIHLPALRERADDIEQLAAFLLTKLARRLNRPCPSLTDAARSALRAHAWPGNVRELENLLERALILADGDTLDAAQLGLAPAPAAASTPGSSLSLDDYFVHFVREREQTETETEIARQLGITRKTLWERRQRLGIPRRRNDE